MLPANVLVHVVGYITFTQISVEVALDLRFGKRPAPTRCHKKIKHTFFSFKGLQVQHCCFANVLQGAVAFFNVQSQQYIGQGDTHDDQSEYHCRVYQLALTR